MKNECVINSDYLILRKRYDAVKKGKICVIVTYQEKNIVYYASGADASILTLKCYQISSTVTRERKKMISKDTTHKKASVKWNLEKEQEKIEGKTR